MLKLETKHYTQANVLQLNRLVSAVCLSYYVINFELIERIHKDFVWFIIMEHTKCEEVILVYRWSNRSGMEIYL